MLSSSFKTVDQVKGLGSEYGLAISEYSSLT